MRSASRVRRPAVDLRCSRRPGAARRRRAGQEGLGQAWRMSWTSRGRATIRSPPLPPPIRSRRRRRRRAAGRPRRREGRARRKVDQAPAGPGAAAFRSASAVLALERGVEALRTGPAGRSAGRTPSRAQAPSSFEVLGAGRAAGDVGPELGAAGLVEVPGQDIGEQFGSLHISWRHLLASG